jgi:hypothetical protein
LEKEFVATITGQMIDHMKQIGRSITLIVTIQNLGLTNQKLNAIIIKKYVIMLGIVGVQLKSFRRMQI